MSYDPSYWDDEVEALFTDWVDYKNKKADRTTGTVDYSNFEICWVHALACLIIVTGGNGHSNFICQDLADMTPNAVNKLVNGTFSLCLRARVPGVSMMHTGTSIRIGAINEMVEHKDASLYFCILRSGHSIENRILEYCLPTDVPLLITARILAGWPYPTKRHFSPRLIRLFESFNQLERVCFKNFMSSVFCSCEDFKTERLRGFQEMLMAVFLMHLDDFCSKYGSTHLIVQEFVRKGNCFGYNFTIFNGFGQIIRDDYNERNIHATVPPNLSETDQELCLKVIVCDRIVRQNIHLVQDMSIFLRKEVVPRLEKLERDNADLRCKVDEILNILRQQQSSVSDITHSLSHKLHLSLYIRYSSRTVPSRPVPYRPVPYRTVPSRTGPSRHAPQS
jgi:hypothetical protein